MDSTVLCYSHVIRISAEEAAKILSTDEFAAAGRAGPGSSAIKTPPPRLKLASMSLPDRNPAYAMVQ